MKNKLHFLNRILSVAMALMLGFALLCPIYNVEAKSKSSSNGGYAEGDNLAFGNIDGKPLSWTILSYDDTTKIAFVISRRPIMSYTVTNYRKAIQDYFLSTGTKAGYVQWNNSYWRGWLNDSFYNNCFNDSERAMIQKHTNTADAAKASIMNFYHDTTLDADYIAKGYKNSVYMDIYNSQVSSSDYIFFLSSDEFTEYKDTIPFETTYSWPLRTNAYDDYYQGLFVDDTTKMIKRGYYYGGDGIRPAMYIKLGETTDSADDSSSTSSTASTSTSTTSSSTSTASTTSTATTSTSKTTSTSTAKSSSKKYANNGTNIGNINLPDDSTYSIRNGGSAQVAIDLEYLNSTDKQYTITYKSSDASVFTVDSSGKITSTGVGTATLTVRMKKSNGKTYTMTCRIDVT